MNIGVLNLIDGFAAGLVLGAFYCAMLWYAVWRVCKQRRSASWLVWTAVPRLGLPILAFYWLMDGHLGRLAACLLGFVAVRFAVQQWAASSFSRSPVNI